MQIALWVVIALILTATFFENRHWKRLGRGATTVERLEEYGQARRWTALRYAVFAALAAVVTTLSSSVVGHVLGGCVAVLLAAFAWAAFRLAKRSHGEAAERRDAPPDATA